MIDKDDVAGAGQMLQSRISVAINLTYSIQTSRVLKKLRTCFAFSAAKLRETDSLQLRKCPPRLFPTDGSMLLQNLLRRRKRTSPRLQRRLLAESLEGRRLLAAYSIDVEIVQVCNTAGTDCTELGPSDTSTALPNDFGYETQINEIWAQADIEINFSYVSWNNSAAVQLSEAELDELFSGTWSGGGTAPPSPIDGLQFFFVKDHEGTGYDPAVPGSGWVANPLPPGFSRNAGIAQIGVMDPVYSTRGRGVMTNEGNAPDQLSGTLAHEIGHALGLRHVNDSGASGNANDPIVTLTSTQPNLLWGGGGGPAYDGGLTLAENFELNSDQIDASILNGLSTDFDPDGNGEGPLKGPPTYTVTTLDDELDSTSPTATVADMGGESDLSLREAIALANQDTDLNVIEFDVSGAGPHIISVASALPTITNPVFIDGTTQTGYSGTPLIGIDGSSAGIADGLKLTASGSTISGLAIYGFSGDGIELASATNNTISSNYVGLDLTGAEDGNSLHGIKLLLSTLNTVDNNVLSGNGGSGLFVNTTTAGANTVSSNMIGTDPTGVLDRGNGSDGITLFSSDNQIGLPTEGNVISGNTRWGIFSRFAGRGTNSIQANLIGVDVTGAAALPNSVGIHIQSDSNQIGGSGTGEGNTISGNTSVGVLLYQATATDNVLHGNMIGTDTGGTIDVGNGIDGVRVAYGSNNEIGGEGVGEGNVISGNNQRGVLMVLTGTTGNQVLGNKIGTDITGNTALANALSGVRFAQDASNNLVQGNQISGNGFAAVSTGNAETVGNDVLFNLIGTDAAGTSPLHNSATIALRIVTPDVTIQGNTISSPNTGIAAWSAATDLVISDNYIGTDSSGTTTSLGMSRGIHLTTGAVDAVISGNTIANNTTAILINGNSSGVRVENNSIYDNTSIGIDLGTVGATANDSGDADSGANNLQNTPVVSLASLSSGTLSLTYQVDSSTSNSAYPMTIEFFLSDGNGQGKTRLGTDTYNAANASTNKTIALSVTGLLVGDKIVATAIDASGNTSEFSLEFAVS